ncbi:hypothetical protein C5B85_17850 [Pseudoclavibacter sp. AY1F1]|uniref:hypothetical protein n=1 Tax=Pseudoclavibacter sp. AY1F1 TaxID=2080583 RepID=UPI000CE76670|nr:hypothetical protein [Pseudoclavibacter sp. AY1F1]PPF41962.1 hypothetical protein C5B85_17850 [Pseudoclavibacter sp. AY1F1]
MSKESTRATLTTVGSLALLAAAVATGLITGQWLLSAGLAVAALLVVFAGPPILGRFTSGTDTRTGSGETPNRATGSAAALPSGAELREWRSEHPGATIADAVGAHRLRG